MVELLHADNGFFINMVAMARCGVLRAPLTMTRAAANGGANKGNKQVGNPKGPGPGRAGKAKPRRGVNGVGAMKMGSDSPMTGRIGEEIQGQQSAAEGGEEGGALQARPRLESTPASKFDCEKG